MDGLDGLVSSVQLQWRKCQVKEEIDDLWSPWQIGKALWGAGNLARDVSRADIGEKCCRKMREEKKVGEIEDIEK